jgi:hypothetical protein
MAGRRGALRVELGCRGGDGSTQTNVRTGVDRLCGMVFNRDMTTTEITDEALDSTAAALTDTLATPSRIARKAGITTTEAYVALAWLVENRMAVATGNGAWTKYRNRQFGDKIR